MCVAENFRQFVEEDKDNWAEIQADESAAGKRKYHRGRRVRQGGIVWMAGAAKIHKGLVEKLIVRVVERRRAENLLPMLVDLVQQDGVLTTDCWRAYGGFAAEATKKAESELQRISRPAGSRPAFPRPDQEAPAAAAAAAAAADPATGSRPGSPTHRTVNHAKHFKDPETGAHSNHIEGMWAVLKNELRRRFGRVGFADMEMMNDRLQLAVWLCNTRLAFQRDKADGLNTVRAFSPSFSRSRCKNSSRRSAWMMTTISSWTPEPERRSSLSTMTAMSTPPLAMGGRMLTATTMQVMIETHAPVRGRTLRSLQTPPSFSPLPCYLLLGRHFAFHPRFTPSLVTAGRPRELCFEKSAFSRSSLFVLAHTS
jgi:hypothetical protein